MAKITNGTLGPRRGIYDWEVTLFQIGGLYGFYYEATDFSDKDPTTPPYSQIEPSIDMNLGYSPVDVGDRWVMVIFSSYFRLCSGCI